MKVETQENNRGQDSIPRQIENNIFIHHGNSLRRSRSVGCRPSFSSDAASAVSLHEIQARRRASRSSAAKRGNHQTSCAGCASGAWRASSEIFLEIISHTPCPRAGHGVGEKHFGERETSLCSAVLRPAGHLNTWCKFSILRSENSFHQDGTFLCIRLIQLRTKPL